MAEVILKTTATNGAKKRNKRTREQAARQRTCAHCGKQFTRDNTPNAGYKYCSPACRKKHGRQKTKQCIMCGATFDAAQGNRTTACQDCAQRFGAQRRAELREKGWEKQCLTCGTRFHTKAAHAKYCSDKCRQRQSQPSTPPRNCRACGAPGVQHPRWYCSDLCLTEAALKRASKRVTDLYALACSIGIHGWDWRQKLYRVLIERDGPRCQICRRKINMTMRSGPNGHPSGNGPSIDHIHPKALGGTDDLWNLQLTHWKCNRAKKTRPKPGSDQLLIHLEAS